MANTATWPTQHNDSALPRHVHVWGDIEQDTPPAYLVAAHGPNVLANMDQRYRPCMGRGCLVRVYGSDVDHPDVLANLLADTRAASPKGATTTS